VNVHGPIELSKQSVAFFREQNPTPGGHFVSISSMAGITVTPGTAVYAATKHGEFTTSALDSALLADPFFASLAIEAYTEALGQELDPTWNIKASSYSSSALTAGSLTLPLPSPISHRSPPSALPSSALTS
jgi:hypothetical protein